MIAHVKVVDRSQDENKHGDSTGRKIRARAGKEIDDPFFETVYVDEFFKVQH